MSTCNLVPRAGRFVCTICQRSLSRRARRRCTGNESRAETRSRGPAALRAALDQFRAARQCVVSLAEEARRLSICEANLCGHHSAGRCGQLSPDTPCGELRRYVVRLLTADCPHWQPAARE